MTFLPKRRISYVIFYTELRSESGDRRENDISRCDKMRDALDNLSYLYKIDKLKTLEVMNKQVTLSFFCVLFFTFQLFAQEEKEFTIGKEYVVKSEILGQDRPILVYLPPDYDKKEKSYP